MDEFHKAKRLILRSFRKIYILIWKMMSFQSQRGILTVKKRKAH